MRSCDSGQYQYGKYNALLQKVTHWLDPNDFLLDADKTIQVE
jgi:hypothetical protein